jgi:hypothetical protein
MNLDEALRFCERARQLVAADSKWPADADPTPLSPELQSDAARFVQAYSDFETTYGFANPTFVSLKISGIIAAQPLVMVEGIRQAALEYAQTTNPFEYISRGAAFDAPVQEPDGAFVFAGPFWAAIAVQKPRVRTLSSGEYEIYTRVMPRANFVQVMCCEGRWILLNGHHRVFAAASMGAERIECMLRPEPTIPHEAFKAQNFFSADVLMSPRPPLVSDFASDDYVLQYTMLPRQQIVRIGTQFQSINAPLPQSL